MGCESLDDVWEVKKPNANCNFKKELIQQGNLLLNEKFSRILPEPGARKDRGHFFFFISLNKTVFLVKKFTGTIIKKRRTASNKQCMELLHTLDKMSMQEQLYEWCQE